MKLCKNCVHFKDLYDCTLRPTYRNVIDGRAEYESVFAIRPYGAGCGDHKTGLSVWGKVRIWWRRGCRL